MKTINLNWFISPMYLTISICLMPIEVHIQDSRCTVYSVLCTVYSVLCTVYYVQ